MKFTINKSEFLKNLLLVGRVIPVKSAFPVKINIMLVLDEEGLHLSGSNDSLAITTTIPFYRDDKQIIRDYQTGGILVKSNLLTELVSKIDKEEITFEVLDDNVVRIENERTSAKINNCLDVNEYTDLDFSTDGVKVELSGQTLLDVISQVSFAASDKNLKPILTSVNIEGNGSEVAFVATDGSRLAKKEIEAHASQRFVANISAKHLQEVARCINRDDAVAMYFNENRLLFVIENTLIRANLNAGTFPNTKNIIPKTFYYVLEVNSQEFINALDRVNVFNIGLVEKDKVVKLNMSESKVIISCKSQTDGTGEDSLDTFRYTGERMEINFNSSYVIDAIKALRSEDVVLSFLGEMKPFTVSSKDDPTTIHLITPVRQF